jgi:membrane-associated phospholipid phosphatase
MRYFSRVAGLASVVIFIIISYNFMDRQIAKFTEILLKKNRLLVTYASDIPDLLFPIACAITILSWIAYYYFRRKKIRSPYIRLFLLIGWTVPLSFFLKTVLKHFFGMTNARVWLADGGEFGFHWFRGGGDYNGFPSGHMVICTVLAIALIRFFPRSRSAVLFAIFLLAAALVVTGYHFVSDVVAGAYLALLVDFSVCRALYGYKNRFEADLI